MQGDHDLNGSDFNYCQCNYCNCLGHQSLRSPLRSPSAPEHLLNAMSQPSRRACYSRHQDPRASQFAGRLKSPSANHRNPGRLTICSGSRSGSFDPADLDPLTQIQVPQPRVTERACLSGLCRVGVSSLFVRYLCCSSCSVAAKQPRRLKVAAAPSVWKRLQRFFG